MMNRSLCRLFGLFLLTILLLDGSRVAVAHETAVFQSSPFISSVSYSYGQNVAFQLSGPMADQVDRVDLFIQAAQEERPFTVEVKRITQSEGQLVANVDVDPTLADLPPFSMVRYWWVLQTAVSEPITTPEETFTYRDDRFAWRTHSVEDVTIYWTGNDSTLGEIAAEIVSDSRQTADDILPQTAVSPLNVYIYPGTADLRAGLRLAERDWQAGHTDPDLGVLLVTAVNPITAAADLRQTLPHELVHLRLHQLAPFVTFPIWYEEGIASFAAEDGLGSDELVQTAVASGTELTLLQLCTNFPEDGAAELALAQSISHLRYIQAQFGNPALRQLGEAYAAGAGCEAGLTDTLGMTMAELNADWLGAQAPQPAWRTFLNQNGLWLLLVVGSFGLFVLLAKK